MSEMIVLYGPGEIIHTRDLDGLVVQTFVVTPEGDIVAVSPKEKR